MTSIRSAYTDLFFGAKCYFRESNRSESQVSFSAACLLAGLTMINVAGFLVLADHVFYGHLEWTNIVLSGRVQVALLAIAVIALPIAYAKALGIYNSSQYQKPAAWPSNAYCVAGIGFAAFVAGIALGVAC
jgi:hypothetical protein